ncbi:MAG: hypothetical protein ACI93H_001675 [Psychromonas sp.]|jgi:hypothetical protein
MMEIKNLLKMDSEIVFGIINEHLRIECDSLDELTHRYNLDTQALIDKLKSVGYHYDPNNNQFKAD